MFVATIKTSFPSQYGLLFVNVITSDICSSENNGADEKCENNCLCDRDQLIHVKDSRKYFFNKSQINNYKTFLTKAKHIEEKANSPPII